MQASIKAASPKVKNRPTGSAGVLADSTQIRQVGALGTRRSRGHENSLPNAPPRSPSVQQTAWSGRGIARSVAFQRPWPRATQAGRSAVWEHSATVAVE